MPDLHALERWMQAAIVHPGTIEEAVRSRAATRHVPLREAERAILPSKTMAPLERLAVYQGMYPLRMRDALAADYPGLAAFLGHHLFEHFVADYVAVHPSRSYTLNRLGDRVPEFVRDLAPPPARVPRRPRAPRARDHRDVRRGGGRRPGGPARARRRGLGDAPVRDRADAAAHDVPARRGTGARRAAEGPPRFHAAEGLVGRRPPPQFRRLPGWT